MKDTGEGKRRREKERERKAIRAKQLFLMLYSTSCTSPQREQRGTGRDTCLEKHCFQSVLKNGYALCLCCHKRTGREEEGTPRSGGEQNGS